MDTSEDKKATFDNFGKSFQEKVLQALMHDKNWATQFIEVFQVDDCLGPQYLKVIANSYIDYYKKYKEFPSTDIMLTIMRDKLSSDKDAVLRQQTINFFRTVLDHKDLGDLPWIKEKAYQFCREQNLMKALSQSVDLIPTGKYETVVDVIKRAIAAGTASSPGLDYNNDIEARYSQTYRKCIKTGIPELDDRKILNGGLGAGEIGIVVAPTGVGKSHVLVHLTAQAITQGKNVFYYTMELNERYVGIRVDSHLTGIPSLDCYERKEQIKEFFEANQEQLGKLIIKEYPGRSITVNTLRAHIEKMSLVGVVPDLIVIDYAGIMRSTEKYDLPRMELQFIIQELRSFGKEINIPVWTALQSNKEGAKSEIIDFTNLSEGFGQAFEADFILGLQRLSTQKTTGYGNVFVAKNRAGMDGMQFKIHLDTSTSTLRVLSEDEIEDMTLAIQEGKNEQKAKTMLSFANSLKEVKKKFDLDEVGKRINDPDSDRPE